VLLPFRRVLIGSWRTRPYGFVGTLLSVDASAQVKAVDSDKKIDSELFRLAAEQTADYAVFLLDTTGHILTWNLGAQRIKGYAADEIIGRHFSTFYPRDALDRGWPAHELTLAAAEGRFEDDGWRIRKDGSRFWASVTISALRGEDGKLLGFSKITRDLTERKLHEEALRQSEERFRLLVDGVTDYAIYMLDPQGLITSWNSGAERIKGYSYNEIIGRHFSRFYAPEDLREGRPWEDLAAARRFGRSEQEGWRFRKNGERFWAKTTLTALHAQEGHLCGFAKVTQDLTEKRHILDLEKAAKNLNEFIAVLAHELRNPLAPIRNAVLVMAKASAADPVQEDMRNTIDRQSAQLARIVDDLLDIARITRGALNLERSAVDLAEVASGAVETSRPLIDAANHRLELDIPMTRLRVNGDAARLTQLVANLLNNAARYTPAGGHITVRAWAEDGWAYVAVRDNGRGIDAQSIDHIFDMFVRGRATRPGEGLGVGLALARRIAEIHGGSLTAHSEGENRGSEFILRVPLVDAPEVWEAARTGAAPATEVRPLVPRRVLVVDDNADAARTLDTLLRSLGHETRAAYGGAEALRVAVEFRPDIVLLDIGMPDVDGYEVARQLRNLENQPAFRIVAITGWGQEPDRQKAKEAGFDVHLVKPVDADELMRILSVRSGPTLH
jgi:PAS domain S-box-containing protein